MRFQIYYLPKKLYILYTSKYIISPLNYISFNSKNIFSKTIDSRHEIVYNKEKNLKGVFTMQNVGERIAEIKDRIKKIDILLDSNISDDLFDSLEAEAITLTEELGRLESLNSIYNAKKLDRVNDWTSNFLHGFKTGTQVITNKQAECFKKINVGFPFIFENYHYDCSGPNYRAGFSHLIITKI